MAMWLSSILLVQETRIDHLHLTGCIQTVLLVMEPLRVSVVDQGNYEPAPWHTVRCYSMPSNHNPPPQAVMFVLGE